MAEIPNLHKGDGSTIEINEDAHLHDDPAIGRIARLRGVFVARAETPIGTLLALAPDFGHMKDPSDAALPRERAQRQADPTDTGAQKRRRPQPLFHGQRGPQQLV